MSRFLKSFGIARGWATAAADTGPIGDPDFTLSNATVTTDWARAVVGTLMPVNVTEPVYFELVDDPAGFGVENG
jgi:hypothetical protein